MFVDSHAHLFFKDYENDLDDVIQRALDAGIEAIINPGTDLATSRESIELAEKYDLIYACVGFHPHDATKADASSLKEIEQLSHHPKVVAIGEIGLDYHYNFSPPERQREVFASQIDIAQRRDLPIVIHSREAEQDTLTIVQEKILKNKLWRSKSLPKGVFHCFPGDAMMANKVIDWGFYISIPGPVTFVGKPNKQNLMAEVVSKISIDNIMVETDSPYLSPVPHRGKRNEPSNIPLIAKRISELQGISIEDVAKGTTHAAKIKSHHNVGGLPKDMKLKLLEPLREFYKDEVRSLGEKLGLPKDFVAKQTFPGPGYAIRIRGEVTRDRLMQEEIADRILLEELRSAKVMEKIYMSFPIMTGAFSTAVKGDGRGFAEVVALRIVESRDVMTSTWARLPYDVLQKISSRIVNEVPNVSRVVFDITTKPPATMEWE